MNYMIIPGLKQDLMPARIRKGTKQKCDDIIELVSKHFEMEVSELLNPVTDTYEAKRRRNICWAIIKRDMPYLSYRFLAEMFWKKELHHKCVIDGIKKVKDDNDFLILTDQL